MFVISRLSGICQANSTLQCSKRLKYGSVGWGTVNFFDQQPVNLYLFALN